jgi:hypothetical protein
VSFPAGRPRHAALGLLLTLVSLVGPAPAQVQPPARPRQASFRWNPEGTALFATFSFRDVIDDRIKQKMTRGLPTHITLAGILFRAGSNEPIASTFHSCKITWHVWEEMYRVEVARPSRPGSHKHWTPTLNGVLRRCAEARDLLVANANQIERGSPIYLRASIMVNPVSEALLSKLKRWVSRPSHTATAAPGSALFSTFTGLFMQRLGEAERNISFTTVTQTPK